MRHTIHRRSAFVVGIVSAMALALAPASAGAQRAASHDRHAVRVLATGLGGTFGSTVGPDGALYVADGVGGRILRVNPKTGASHVYADGLPKRVFPVGGATDVAFIGDTAYALVSLVSPDVGGSSVDGIYRIDGRHRNTVVADIGAFTRSHPPATDFFIPSGLQFAMTLYRGRFLVTDGHHNRVYRVGLNGSVTEADTFDDIVPTGIMTWGHRVLMTEAGPVPHLPENGRLVRLALASGGADEIASGARLAVDVARAGHRLYLLSQGVFPAGGQPGDPAEHDTGAVMLVHGDGSVSAVATGLDQPVSMQIIGHTAYVVTLGGTIDAITLGSHR